MSARVHEVNKACWLQSNFRKQNTRLLQIHVDFSTGLVTTFVLDNPGIASQLLENFQPSLQLDQGEATLGEAFPPALPKTHARICLQAA